MKNPTVLHYGFNINEPEISPVQNEDITADIHYGDDVCEVI